LQGPTANPKINGFFKIENGEFNSYYLTRKAKDVQMDLEIKSNQVHLKSCQASVGKGVFKASGSFDGEWKEEELFLDHFNLKAFSEGQEGIRIQVPELPVVKARFGLPSVPSKGSASFSIELTGTKEDPKMAGWIQIQDALLSYPPPKEEETASHWFKSMDWDLELKTGPHVIFQNDFAYARLDGQLRFKGAKENLLVNGNIHSNEGGITLYGGKFDLLEAVFEVLQPPSFELKKTTYSTPSSRNIAYLQLRAEKNTFSTTSQGDKISDTITVQLERTPLTEEFDSEKLTFRSSQNPNMPSEKVATQAGLGIDLETADPAQREVELRQGIARLLDSQLASPLARSILQQTGLVDRIEITQNAEEGRSKELRGEEPSAIDPLIGQSILLERTFGSKLGIGYKATVDKIRDKADLIHQLQLRYPFYKGFWIYGSRELDSEANLGRPPESKAGIQFRRRFDPADWFKKKQEDQ
jgi:hypothetical protein